MIVSSTGKKIYPSRVESLFNMAPLIRQVLLIGDRLPFLTALFTINVTAAESLKGMEDWKGRPPAEIVQAPPVVAEIQKAVVRVNQQLAPFEQVRKHRILGRDFTIEDGELTATMKVRRTRDGKLPGATPSCTQGGERPLHITQRDRLRQPAAGSRVGMNSWPTQPW